MNFVRLFFVIPVNMTAEELKELKDCLLEHHTILSLPNNLTQINNYDNTNKHLNND